VPAINTDQINIKWTEPLEAQLAQRTHPADHQRFANWCLHGETIVKLKLATAFARISIETMLFVCIPADMKCLIWLSVSWKCDAEMSML
jgi:hypothetical protein